MVKNKNGGNRMDKLIDKSILQRKLAELQS